MFHTKKLFKLLIDRGMKKQDLQKKAGISSASVSKLAKKQICKDGSPYKNLFVT